MNQQEMKKIAAKAALKFVTPDTIVGVGSGSTVNCFIDELASDSTDTALAGYVDGTMFEHDENRKLVNSGLASLEFDVPGKTVKVTLNSKDYIYRSIDKK